VHAGLLYCKMTLLVAGKQEAEKGAAVVVADDQARQQFQDPDFSAEITIVHIVRILLAVAVS
jgi:hypothetical protein